MMIRINALKQADMHILIIIVIVTYVWVYNINIVYWVTYLGLWYACHFHQVYVTGYEELYKTGEWTNGVLGHDSAL